VHHQPQQEVDELDPEDYIVTTKTTKVVDAQGRTQSITTKTIKTLADGSNIIETTTKNISRSNSRSNSLRTNSLLSNSNYHTNAINLSKIDEDLHDFDYNYMDDNLHLNPGHQPTHHSASPPTTQTIENHHVSSNQSNVPGSPNLPSVLVDQPHKTEHMNSITSNTSSQKPRRSILKNTQRPTFDDGQGENNNGNNNNLSPDSPNLHPYKNLTRTSGKEHVSSPPGSIQFKDEVETITIEPRNVQHQSPPQQHFHIPQQNHEQQPSPKNRVPDADFYNAAMQAAYKKVYGDRAPEQVPEQAPVQKHKASPKILSLPFGGSPKQNNLLKALEKVDDQGITDKGYNYENHHKSFVGHSLREAQLPKATSHHDREKQEEKLRKQTQKEEQQAEKLAKKEAELAEKQARKDAKLAGKENKKANKRKFGLFGRRKSSEIEHEISELSAPVNVPQGVSVESKLEPEVQQTKGDTLLPSAIIKERGFKGPVHLEQPTEIDRETSSGVTTEQSTSKSHPTNHANDKLEEVVPHQQKLDSEVEPKETIHKDVTGPVVGALVGAGIGAVGVAAATSSKLMDGFQGHGPEPSVTEDVIQSARLESYQQSAPSQEPKMPESSEVNQETSLKENSTAVSDPNVHQVEAGSENEANVILTNAWPDTIESPLLREHFIDCVSHEDESIDVCKDTTIATSAVNNTIIESSRSRERDVDEKDGSIPDRNVYRPITSNVGGIQNIVPEETNTSATDIGHIQTPQLDELDSDSDREQSTNTFTRGESVSSEYSDELHGIDDDTYQVKESEKIEPTKQLQPQASPTYELENSGYKEAIVEVRNDKSTKIPEVTSLPIDSTRDQKDSEIPREVINYLKKQDQNSSAENDIINAENENTIFLNGAKPEEDLHGTDNDDGKDKDMSLEQILHEPAPQVSLPNGTGKTPKRPEGNIDKEIDKLTNYGDFTHDTTTTSPFNPIVDNNTTGLDAELPPKEILSTAGVSPHKSDKYAIGGTGPAKKFMEDQPCHHQIKTDNLNDATIHEYNNTTNIPAGAPSTHDTDDAVITQSKTEASGKSDRGGKIKTKKPNKLKKTILKYFINSYE
jgi:hypothetical protein